MWESKWEEFMRGLAMYNTGALFSSQLSLASKKGTLSCFSFEPGYIQGPPEAAKKDVDLV